ncbi:thymocyte nuclear protein 1-like [Acipenser oxyrinchus oxyrinchus]|uniref:Thymocyte nuclear protein 1 n=1 Tax=Acipenser oxyrinchus oxyrinchus TaxID=40147 RepID=A0AAD8CQT1_ACIOX|nr:thymocyte nuclear protein 1-like [Acipenser oxyrinchus oxyrinchus]
MPPKRKRVERSAKLNTEQEEAAAKPAEKEPPPGDSPEDAAKETSLRSRKKPAAKSSGKETDKSKAAPGDKVLHSYWLMKSEPESRIENGVDVKFGIEDLKAQPEQTGCWDGVRNYQARNFMRDMKVGQLAFFYHSNCKEPGIAGLMKIVRDAYVDHTQFDKNDVHYDRSSKEDNPKWSMVDVQFVRMMERFIPLAELKKYHHEHKSKGGPLKHMALFTRARLSVQPLTKDEFDFVLSLEDKKPF